MEASRLDVSGKPLQIRRQKGALFNDTMSGAHRRLRVMVVLLLLLLLLCPQVSVPLHRLAPPGCLSALAGVLPLTTFAQNNGVISLTAVAARRVGISAGVWLLIMGILAKIGAFIKTIPGPVLGGMTTFLFANVLASGMHILLEDPGGLRRRNRFIVAATMGVGVGVTIWPQWARNNLWPLDAHSAWREGSEGAAPPASLARLLTAHPPSGGRLQHGQGEARRARRHHPHPVHRLCVRCVFLKAAGSNQAASTLTRSHPHPRRLLHGLHPQPAAADGLGRAGAHGSRGAPDE